MTPTWWGMVLGAVAGLGVVLVVSRLMVIRKPQLSARVLPYVRDLPQSATSTALTSAAPPANAAAAVFGPPVRALAGLVERVLGGAASVRRRLERANIDKTVHEFRIEQVLWGLGAFSATAAYSLLRTLTDPGNPIALLILCGIAFVVGVVLRDNKLSSQVKQRERMIVAEFPTVAELLALSVAAGESPVAALGRVVQRSGGELSADLGRVLAAVRTGEPVASAFDAMAASTGLPMVARFAQGIAVAVERGTPLADVLHAQAGDVREAGRRELIEVAARREVLMMMPVVFLVLPVTILFAFWPGVIGLSLSTP